MSAYNHICKSLLDTGLNNNISKSLLEQTQPTECQQLCLDSERRVLPRRLLQLIWNRSAAYSGSGRDSPNPGFRSRHLFIQIGIRSGRRKQNPDSDQYFVVVKVASRSGRGSQNPRFRLRHFFSCKSWNPETAGALTTQGSDRYTFFVKVGIPKRPEFFCLL